MIIPTKKLKCGFEVPVFGMGTWLMGGGKTRDWQNDDKADIAAIKKAIDMGITHIDTAESYAEGHTDEIVADAIKGYDRSKLFIASKVKKENLRYNDVIKSLKANLERLKTDYLDLYLIHAPAADNIPIEETMKALNDLKDQGLIRNIGVSNFSIKRFEEAQSVSKNKIVVNQLHYNLLIRENEKNGLLEHCQKYDVIFMAWRPVQRGILSQENIPVIKEMMDKYHKTATQIAINWLISQPDVVTISKMRNPDHIEENLGALGWQMEKSDIEKLRNEFPGQQTVSDAVPLR